MSGNNNRILKNTLFLYFRMFLTMVVSLYTVRVVLNTLGVEDYGIFNVVAGVVTMFSFLSGTMASASQRFFAFELGRMNFDRLKKTFSVTMTIYILIALIILFLAETVGLWFLNNTMSIPIARIGAANWVYQFSILSFMMTMFTIPYNAAIIAHEKMTVYAYVSILEVSLKLLVVVLLTSASYDKLKLYAVLMFCVTSLITFIYRQYCIRLFSECRYSFYWEKGLFQDILSFSGWNVIGSIALVAREQGINILLNIFFNPIINAARAVAFQVASVVNSFVTNLQTAMNPHITKTYASGEFGAYLVVINQGARFSFYLLLLLSLPILLETEYIMRFWLGSIPPHTVNFVRLIIIISLVDTLYRTVVMGISATGKIKVLQLVVGGLNLTILPISFVFLKNGLYPEIVFYVTLSISLIGIIPRLYILKRKVPLFSISAYLKDVILNIVLVSVLSLICPLTLMHLLRSNDSMLSFFSVVICSISSVLICVYIIGLKQQERRFLHHKISEYRLKFLKA